MTDTDCDGCVCVFFRDRVRPRGQLVCRRCGAAMDRRRADGHTVCWPCQKKAKRKRDEQQDKENADPNAATRDHLISTLQSTRKHKPFQQLQPRQKRARLHDVKAFAALTDTPLSAIQPPRIPAANLIHLPYSTRRSMRTVDGLRIASEKKIKEYKLMLAQHFGTETAAINTNEVTGAYITDPIYLVELLAERSPFICIGGDCGGGVTKLGITYLNENKKAAFAALLVFSESDHYESLTKLLTPDLTPFKSHSQLYRNIFHVFQRFINLRQLRSRPVFLNGDWVFINAVLGLMAPGANFPCPVCVVHRRQLLSTAPRRDDTNRFSVRDSAWTIYPGRPQLLRIDPEFIVPLPLHLFLGIGNRVILECLPALLGEQPVASSVASIKTNHTPGHGGLSDVHGLNGPEIARFIQTAYDELEDETPLSIDRAKMDKLMEWLKKLHTNLLKKREWNQAALDSFQQLIREIWWRWESTSGSRAFPKLHMLAHAWEFAKKFKMLAEVSEAQIESYHYKFGAKQHRHHMNQANKPAEQQRRSLSDLSCEAIRPLVRSVLEPL